MRASFDHPTLGAFDCVPLPFKFDGFEDPQPARPPLLGEHTDALLGAMLGKTEEQIAALRAAKVI